MREKEVKDADIWPESIKHINHCFFLAARWSSHNLHTLCRGGCTGGVVGEGIEVAPHGGGLLERRVEEGVLWSWIAS